MNGNYSRMRISTMYPASTAAQDACIALHHWLVLNIARVTADTCTFHDQHDLHRATQSVACLVASANLHDTCLSRVLSA